MEGMVDKDFWRRKRVLLTGHTGFKGSWLALWLQTLGAEVIGYSLPPPTKPSLFDLAEAGRCMISVEGNVLDYPFLLDTVQNYRPEIVFHLAAQSLVIESYENPLWTYATNVMGTIHVLEAVRQAGGARVLVIVTSDKCYENKEWVWGYRENDAMGGTDPYSCSKGCAELITSSYRESFFQRGHGHDHCPALASVRAGNVIGGGDWGKDRLIPDIMKALLESQSISIRHPQAVRPWQHVLEPLRGYLLLAEKCYRHGSRFAEAWNFGPREEDARPVSWIVKKIIEAWGEDARWERKGEDLPHEARILKLDCSKARTRLGWAPLLTLDQSLEWVVDWYRTYKNAPSSLRALTLSHIAEYSQMRNQRAFPILNAIESFNQVPLAGAI